MKKILSISVILLFASSILFTSCNTNRLCPAYPPTVYHGDVQQNNNDQVTDFELTNIQEENL